MQLEHKATTTPTNKNVTDLVAEQIDNLYVTGRKRFIYASYSSKIWYTHIYDENKPYNSFSNRRLTTGLIRQHLEGKGHYGTYTNSLAKFITFDFDFADSWEECVKAHKQLTQYLNSIGVPLNGQHTYYSGSKGVHLTLYFDDVIEFNILESFFKHAVNGAGLEKYLSSVNKHKIELKRGTKLPLGFHHKTRNKCVKLDTADLSKVLPDTDILKIDPFNAQQFKDGVAKEIVPANKARVQPVQTPKITAKPNITVIDLVEGTTPLESYNKYNAVYYEELLENGVIYEGSQHNTVRTLAMYLNGKGYSIADTVEKLTEWLTRVEGYYNTDLETAIAEMESSVAWVYEKNAVINPKTFEVHIEPAETEAILTATMATGKQFTTKRKQLLFAITVHAKRYGGEKFYMTYEQMASASPITSRDKLIQAVTEFEKAGLIAIHRRNERVQGSLKSLPNVYEVLFLAKEDTADNSISSATTNGATKLTKLTPDTFTGLVSKQYTAKELRKILPRNQVSTFIA